MSDALFGSLVDGIQRVMDLRAAQHELTAANLANADTPGFRARYIPFDRVLARAVGRGDGLELLQSDPRHLAPPGEDPAEVEVEELEPPPWAEDGNSVVPEREVARLTENSLLYTALARGLGKRLAILRYAASDGRG